MSIIAVTISFDGTLTWGYRDSIVTHQSRLLRLHVIISVGNHDYYLPQSDSEIVLWTIRVKIQYVFWIFISGADFSKFRNPFWSIWLNFLGIDFNRKSVPKNRWSTSFLCHLKKQFLLKKWASQLTIFKNGSFYNTCSSKLCKLYKKAHFQRGKILSSMNDKSIRLYLKANFQLTFSKNAKLETKNDENVKKTSHSQNHVILSYLFFCFWFFFNKKNYARLPIYTTKYG